MFIAVPDLLQKVYFAVHLLLMALVLLLLHGAQRLFFYYFADGDADAQDVVLPVQEDMVPHHACHAYVESAAEQGEDPTEQKDAAAHHLLRYQVFVENRTGLFEQAPEDLVGDLDPQAVDRVKVVEQLHRRQI